MKSKGSQAKKMNTYTLAFMGVMIAIVYVVTMFRFPLLGSKVHFANSMCLLSGLLFGPFHGAVAAGLGSAIYDVFNGYTFVDALITFVSKGAMAYVCAVIAWGGKKNGADFARNCVAGAVGAMTYVALYMLKTFIFQAFVYAFPMDTVWATMLSKLIPSLINAGFAMVVTPVLMRAIYPMLKATGMLEKMRT